MYDEKIKSALIEAGADIEKILNLFNVQYNYNKKMILCPFHDDRTPSMKINDDNSVHCFACDFHFDIVQLYAALESNDAQFGESVWDNNNLDKVISNMVSKLGLELDINLESGKVESEQDKFLRQLKEKGLDSVPDSLYQKNPPMIDKPFSQISLPAKNVYLYKDPETKEVLSVKVRYEALFGLDSIKVFYRKSGSDYIESFTAIPEKSVKRKSFRFYNVVDGKINNGPLPDNKKDIIYNGERVFEWSKNKRSQTWVWFVEGEKDVETLKEYGFIGVSLMKGANSKWSNSYNKIFRECNVIIASDYDEAGQTYEGTLFEALMYATYEESTEDQIVKKECVHGLKKLNKLFFEANKMPEKSDITDLINKWKHDGLSKQEITAKLEEIIERSIDYKNKFNIVETSDGLYIGNRKIADFTIADAINIISIDNAQSDMIQLSIKGSNKSESKLHTRVACIHEVFGSSDAFNKTFSVIDCTFLGKKEELFMTKKFILNHKIFHNRFMYPSNGMYKHHGEWITVTPEGSLKSDGSFDKDIFSSNNIMYSDLMDVQIPLKSKINEVVPALLNFNIKEVVYNVLGEVGCKLLNARYKDLGIKNHLFSLNGTKGAGKTETSVKIIAALTNNNTRGEYNLTGQSNFTFLKNVSSNNIGGMILQELKLGKMSDYDKNRWSEIFRNNYDRSKSQRGTKDQELNQYDQNNPLITTGEEGIGEESALFERFNMIFMTAENRRDPSYTENFRILCDNQDALHGIGKQLIIEIMNLEDKTIKEDRYNIEKEIRNKGLDKKGFVDRVLNNVINVIHGLTIVGNTLKKLGFDGEINLSEGFDTIINNFLDNILRINDDNSANDDYQNMLLQFQKALDNDYEDKVVGNANDAYNVYDKSLWISPSKIRTVVANFVQDSKQSYTVLSENEFRKNLIKAEYIHDDSASKKKFNQVKAKGWYYKVDISKIKQLELSFIDELIEKSEIKVPEDIYEIKKIIQKDKAKYMDNFF